MTPHPRTAITGGTGFVGRHLAERLGREASVIISRRTGVDTSDVDALTRAFEGYEVVAHCAGINREIDDQTYQRVHIEGTANVIEAAKRAGVRKIIMLSFLRARPHCGSPYHETKWAAEELIRDSGLESPSDGSHRSTSSSDFAASGVIPSVLTPRRGRRDRP